MNRLHRLVTLPLLFAALGVSAVVALGEPVQHSTSDVLCPDEPAPVAMAANAHVVPTEAAGGRSLTALERASHASWMRWRITLPSVRPRRPV